MKSNVEKLEAVDEELSLIETRLFATRAHALTLEQVCAVVFSWINLEVKPCRFVVTPNVDHILQLQSNQELRLAYDTASLIIADGWPVVVASRMLRSPLPERVAGSDLVPELMLKWSGPRPLRVFLLGAAPGVAEKAAASIVKAYPCVEVCGTYSPPFGFEEVDCENENVVSKVNASAPDLLVVGLGAPKQEIWLCRFASRLNAKVAIAAGGTIDFLAGAQIRAPIWMRRCGLEWVHRLLMDPRRLAKRYLRGAWIFPKLVVREFVQRSLPEALKDDGPNANPVTRLSPQFDASGSERTQTPAGDP